MQATDKTANSYLLDPLESAYYGLRDVKLTLLRSAPYPGDYPMGKLGYAEACEIHRHRLDMVETLMESVSESMSLISNRESA